MTKQAHDISTGGVYNGGLTPLQQDAARYANLIEAEMRHIGLWQSQDLSPEKFASRQAFAMDTMTFGQWLQFIFLPRLREAVDSGNFPAESNVGTQAVREFDGQAEAERLVRLLSEFDALFP